MTVAQGELIVPQDILDCAFFPRGMILMYDGDGWVDNETLPGWYQCNGENETPDLRDRFICGGDSTGDTGNSTNTITAANIPSHNHSFSGTAGATKNTNNQAKNLVGYFNYGEAWEISQTSGIVSQLVTDNKGTDKSEAPSIGSNIDARHGHDSASINGDSTDEGTGTGTGFKLNSVPPYYAVIYIKKVN
ncbi:MAG: hypothetical protein LBD99_06740 [Candidatus Margulisbacteria bacterium]|nr:hypothetical protein [Candidatus Margulisiibacteriota bacterium]